MTERSRAILEAAVQDFVKTKQPITSERLYETYDFGIKPAMIRWELSDLAENGFFSQKHPSGGRIPTDKAYRFFVENSINDESGGEKSINPFRGLIGEFMNVEHRDFIKDVAERFGILGAGFEPDENEFYGSGLNELLERMDNLTKDDMVEIVRDFEMLPERIIEHRAWWEKENNWPQVFIGESPVTKSPHLSVMATYLECEPENFLMFTIGPKQMDYAKPIRFLKSLKRSTNNKQ
jgi:transcriptional regulator of heat shock response